MDVACGMAVLRGADVFAQGILGAPHGTYRTFSVMEMKSMVF